jgi:Fe-S cluster biosynthesis and repair protein YggX
MSQNRRLRRLQERQSKKLYEKIRLETMNKLSKMSPEDRKVLEEEYKQFLKQKEDGM